MIIITSNPEKRKEIDECYSILIEPTKNMEVTLWPTNGFRESLAIIEKGPGPYGEKPWTSKTIMIDSNVVIENGLLKIQGNKYSIQDIKAMFVWQGHHKSEYYDVLTKFEIEFNNYGPKGKRL